AFFRFWLPFGKAKSLCSTILPIRCRMYRGVEIGFSLVTVHCSLCVLTKDRTPNQKHLTLAPRFNANPIIVRVRPHKRSDAEPEASHAGSEVQREPDHSEGASSQKIGRRTRSISRWLRGSTRTRS